MYDFTNFYYIVKVDRKIENVAFYDRASTIRQQDNYARSSNSDAAVQICKNKGWNLFKSGDPRNNGVCFLDVGTGAIHTNRPKLYKLFGSRDIDTIAVIDQDRLSRDLASFNIINKWAKFFHKNIICFENDADKHCTTQMIHIFYEYYRNLQKMEKRMMQKRRMMKEQLKEHQLRLF